jgi:hypothetical protein
MSVEKYSWQEGAMRVTRVMGVAAVLVATVAFADSAYAQCTGSALEASYKYFGRSGYDGEMRKVLPCGTLACQAGSRREGRPRTCRWVLKKKSKGS